jgi:hypothetical protein
MRPGSWFTGFVGLKKPTPTALVILIWPMCMRPTRHEVTRIASR